MGHPTGAPALRFIRSHVFKSGEERERSAVRDAQLLEEQLGSSFSEAGLVGSCSDVYKSPLPVVRMLLPASPWLFPAGREGLRSCPTPGVAPLRILSRGTPLMSAGKTGC